jgi:hypothetical protein
MTVQRPATREREGGTRASGDAVLVKLFTENVQPRTGRTGWHGGPTPLGALRGVSAEQAVWRPAPGRKTIWELMLHIAYWKYAVRRQLERTTARGGFARKPANWPEAPTRADEERWREDIALLRAEHERLVLAISRVPLSRYGAATPTRRRWTVGELIVGIAQHDAYHAAQIQLMKRLWAERSS